MTSPSNRALLPRVRPRIVIAVTLLPEPDSPTMPSTSPRSSVKLTPSTAWTMPSSVAKLTFRSLTSRSRSAIRRATVAMELSPDAHQRSAARAEVRRLGLLEHAGDVAALGGVQDAAGAERERDGRCGLVAVGDQVAGARLVLGEPCAGFFLLVGIAWNE